MFAKIWHSRNLPGPVNPGICQSMSFQQTAKSATECRFLHWLIWNNRLWQIPRVTDLARFVEWQILADMAVFVTDSFFQWQIWQIIGMTDSGRLLDARSRWLSAIVACGRYLLRQTGQIFELIIFVNTWLVNWFRLFKAKHWQTCYLSNQEDTRVCHSNKLPNMSQKADFFSGKFGRFFGMTDCGRLLEWQILADFWSYRFCWLTRPWVTL